MAKLPTEAELLSVENILAPMFRQYASQDDVDRLYFYAVRAEWSNVGKVEQVSTWPDAAFGRNKQAVDIRLKAKSITVVAETPEGKTIMIHSDAVEDVNMRHLALAPSPAYRFGSMDQQMYDKEGGEYRIDARFMSYEITETIGGTFRQEGPHGLFLPRSTFLIPTDTRGITMVELD